MTLQHERLANEPEHTATKAGLLTTFLLATVMVVGVNAWAARVSPAAERTFDGLTVAKKWELASTPLAAGGIAVVGDSSGNFAVVGSKLSESLGRPTVNLCTYGRFLVNGARWTLDRVTEVSEAPPSLALAVFGTQTFVKPVDGFTFAQMPITGAQASAGRAGIPTSELLQFGVSRVFPLFTQSTSFGRAVRTGSWEIDPTRLPIDPDGSSSLPAVYPDSIPGFVKKKAIPEIAAFEGPVPSVRDRAAIEQMIQDADARGYDLVFVDGPIWSGMAGLPEQVELTRKAHEYLDAICATSERAWHLPGPMQTFEAAEMENPFHISRPAAERFTAELVRRLRELGLPR